MQGKTLSTSDEEEQVDELVPLMFIHKRTDTLIRLLESDEFQEAPEMFGKIMDELVAMEPHMLPLVRSRLLAFVLSLADKLIGTGVFTESEMPVNNMVNQIHRAPNYQELHEYLVMCVDKLVAIRLRRQKVTVDALIRKVKALIQDSYTNPNLSVQMLAETFGVSQPYLSTSFKTQTGTRVIDYIHEIRINQAVSLLECTDLNIDEICQAVGYSSSSTIFRSFQKYRGLSPASYRKGKK